MQYIHSLANNDHTEYLEYCDNNLKGFILDHHKFMNHDGKYCLKLVEQCLYKILSHTEDKLHLSSHWLDTSSNATKLARVDE